MSHSHLPFLCPFFRPVSWGGGGGDWNRLYDRTTLVVAAMEKKERSQEKPITRRLTARHVACPRPTHKKTIAKKKKGTTKAKRKRRALREGGKSPSKDHSLFLSGFFYCNAIGAVFSFFLRRGKGNPHQGEGAASLAKKKRRHSQSRGKAGSLSAWASRWRGPRAMASPTAQANTQAA